MRSQTNRAAGSTIDCFLDQPRLVLGTSALEGRLFRSFFFLLVAPTASAPTILGTGSRMAVLRGITQIVLSLSSGLVGGSSSSLCSEAGGGGGGGNGVAGVKNGLGVELAVLSSF